MSTDPKIGNTISLRNASKVPANIYYYTLESQPRTWLHRLRPRFGKPVRIEFNAQATTVDVTVPAYGQAKLFFVDKTYFEWVDRKDDLYLRLWIVGLSKPIHFLVAKASQ